MFYLIGGIPRTGKTTLAKRVSEKLGIPWISTDTLESVVQQYVSEGEFSLLFPKCVIRRETKQSNDLLYGKYSAQEIVYAYMKQAEALEQAIGVFLESEVKNNQSYILEGYHITPAFVDRLKDGFEIQSIFLGREDERGVCGSIVADPNPNNWVVGKTEDEKTFGKIAKMIVDFSKKCKEEARKHNQQYHSMDGDFETRLNEASNYLM